MREDVKAYELKDAVVACELKEDVKAYGDNKLVIPIPDTVPDAVKVVHSMSWVIVDPDDIVKFPDDKVKQPDAFNRPVTTKPWPILQAFTINNPPPILAELLTINAPTV